MAVLVIILLSPSSMKTDFLTRPLSNNMGLSPEYLLAILSGLEDI